jgi:hypothetical protein
VSWLLKAGGKHSLPFYEAPSQSGTGARGGSPLKRAELLERGGGAWSFHGQRPRPPWSSFSFGPREGDLRRRLELHLAWWPSWGSFTYMTMLPNTRTISRGGTVGTDDEEGGPPRFFSVHGRSVGAAAHAWLREEGV